MIISRAFIVLLLQLLLNRWSCIHHHHRGVVDGMKHTFYIERTSHSIIGPITPPFGFIPRGHVSITVNNFVLQVKQRNKKKKKNQQQEQMIYEQTMAKYEAGFYLQRYDTIASFHQHYNQFVSAISNHTTKSIQETCTFAHWLNDDDDETRDRLNRRPLGVRRLQADTTDDDFLTTTGTTGSTSSTDHDFYSDHMNSNSGTDDDDDNNNDDDDDFRTGGGSVGNDDYFSTLTNNNNNNGNIISSPISTTTTETKSAATTTSSNNNIDDDMVFYRYNTNTTSAKNGIFLSMKSYKNSPLSVQYTFQSGEEGLYFLIYQICPPPSNDENDITILSSFTLDIDHYNTDVFGNKSYLSAGEMKLPFLYLFFTISYILCFGIWYSNIRSIQKGNYGHFYKPITVSLSSSSNESLQRPVLHHIHQLMSLVIILKFISMLFESLRFYFKKMTGHAEVWSILYTIVSCINIFFFFTVIVLLGTGWSIITPFVERRTKYMIVCVLVLQVVNNIAILVLSQETDGESYYQTWLGILHIVDILCCCAVIVPIVWQITALEKNAGLVDNDVAGTLANSTGDDGIVSPWKERVEALESGSMDPILEKLKLFRTFYLIVVAYMYSTRILIYLFSSILSYKYVWVEHFIIEVVTLTFYVTVGVLFRPVPEVPFQYQQRNGIAAVRDDDDDVVSLSGDEQQSLTGKNGGFRHRGIELRPLQSCNASATIKKV